MNENVADTKGAGTRFPFISLEKAIGRAKELFDADQKGREMTIAGAFGVWGYSEKSSGGFQTIAALKMYGLIKDSSAGDSRKLGLTDTALRYFRDEREDEKKKLAREFALKPKLIAALWSDWNAIPPADSIARSHLKAERGLNDQGARSLLSIYKENMTFTELKAGDKVDEVSVENANEDAGEGEITPAARPLVSLASLRKVPIMPGERELTTGLLAKEASFRLIVTGNIGVKEIERLIKKLEIDKEILAEQEEIEEIVRDEASN
jgi:hypothetical protein